jgi:hypothetical protein
MSGATGGAALGGAGQQLKSMGYGQPQQFSGLNNLPQGSYQIPGYGGGPPPQAQAAANRPQYSPDNPYGGLYANPQADAWQQQRAGGMPPPPMPAQAMGQGIGRAPGLPPQAAQPAQQNMMRKALGTGDVPLPDNGYGHGTPGGYRLDTAPSTLDPGSMTALLGIMGGNVNGTPWNRQAANYANWYTQTYGKQAPGGPRAYGQ